MFQNPAIDIAIGLILMYLVLSLLCTVINEFIASKLSLRSRNLEAGLRELLDDPTVRNAFYNHGLISGTRKALERAGGSLMASGTKPPATTATGTSVAAPPLTPTAATGPVAAATPGEHPSYLSAETFALALMGSLSGPDLTGNKKTPTFADIEQSIEALPASKIKSALQASLLSAQGKFDAFRASVTTWFDDSMDRLSGAYKRHLKLISIVVGFVVAVTMNADTFAVGRALWSDGSLRGQLVQAGEAAVKNGLPETTAAGEPPDVAKAYRGADEKLRPLPIGWPLRAWPSDRLSTVTGPALVAGWTWFGLTTLAGWFATGLALSLGAPFWFDLLSRFVNIRAAGVKPHREDAKAKA